MADLRRIIRTLRSADHRHGIFRERGSSQWLPSAIVTGTVASIATGATLALLARAQGKGALQPVNATSHWLNGPGAGRVRELDVAHTAIGYATHHASCVFWALPFEWWLSSRRERSAAEVLGGAVAVAGIAAVVDYGIVPKRLTPGWELTVSQRSVAVTFGAMALGLAVGSFLAQNLRHRRRDRSPRPPSRPIISTLGRWLRIAPPGAIRGDGARWAARGRPTGAA